MTPERYQKVCDIFAEAQDFSGPEREKFLTAACGNDQDLRNEVDSLLVSDENSGNFIESPALEIAGQMLAEEKKTATSRYRDRVV